MADLWAGGRIFDWIFVTSSVIQITGLQTGMARVLSVYLHRQPGIMLDTFKAFLRCCSCQLAIQQEAAG
jgi:hypothetical protein